MQDKIDILNEKNHDLSQGNGQKNNFVHLFQCRVNFSFKMIIQKDLESAKRTSINTINKLNTNITHLMGDVKLLQNDKESDESGCDILSFYNRKYRSGI